MRTIIVGALLGFLMVMTGLHSFLIVDARRNTIETQTSDLEYQGKLKGAVEVLMTDVNRVLRIRAEDKQMFDNLSFALRIASENCKQLQIDRQVIIDRAQDMRVRNSDLENQNEELNRQIRLLVGLINQLRAKLDNPPDLVPPEPEPTPAVRTT